MNKYFKTFSKLQIILFLLIIFFSLVIRTYKIESVPPSLYYDEVDYGYQAKSLISTFKDYRGSLSPFYVHSFNDIRAPIPAYFTALTTLIFSSPELQVRGPSFILGTGIVVLGFLLIYLWTKSFWAAFFVSLVFATSPWQIVYSRFSHEVISMMFIYLGATLCFFRYIKTKSFIYLIFATVFFALSIYTYRTMSLFVPFTFLSLFLLFRSDLLILGWKKLVFLVFLASMIILPFLYATTLGAPDIPRINQLSITSDSEIPIWVQRNREVDSGDFNDPSIGKSALPSSYFFHNKLVSWVDTFFNNYFAAFSSEFLFIKGDPNHRHAIQEWGQLYFIDIIGLFAGLLFLWNQRKQKTYQWVFIWLLSAPVLSAVTSDGAYHASRLFVMSIPLLMIVGLGWYYLFINLLKSKRLRFILPILTIIWAIQVSFYLHKYLIHYPVDSSRYFGYGFKQAMTKIAQEEVAYEKVIFVPDNDPPMIYFLYWSNIHPKFLQEYGTNFSQDKILNKRLDKYKVNGWTMDPKEQDKDIVDKFELNTIYLVTKNQIPRDLTNINELPKGLKLIDIIKYPDNEVAFYIVARDPNVEITKY